MNTETAKSIDKRLYTIHPSRKLQVSKDEYTLSHFHENLAYRYATQRNDTDPGKLLESMKERYLWYRKSWRGLPREAIKQQIGGDYVNQFKTPPLSIDLETAALCNLACPFCFRQWIATPDKIMDSELAFGLIDQAAELGVPSLKFNWRGEPMMHPKLPQLINYAKKKGILETLINTNATFLDQTAANKLIDAGLDTLIYSFDGGTEKTYLNMRPGRFKDNSFSEVYENIKNFALLKKEKGAPFPFTKIQMVLTDEAFPEQEQYYQLFSDYVDEVTTAAYMERGGNLRVLQPEDRASLVAALPNDRNNLDDIQYWKETDGTLYLETGRLPCEQPFQRLMVSYDGRVFMCCLDWGNEHPLGYVSDKSFTKGDTDYTSVLERAEKNKKGYELMNLTMPERYTNPKKIVRTLGEIWNGREINSIRERHVRGALESIPICKKCTFKDTYAWKQV
jgi:MoaA/NifB/PqqE/SkfB family radical SAM enzyme